MILRAGKGAGERKWLSEFLITFTLFFIIGMDTYDFTKFKCTDSKFQSHYDVSSEKIIWCNVKRNDLFSLYSDAGDVFHNFSISFNLTVTNIKKVSGRTSHLITLLKLGNNKTIMSVYTKEVDDTDQEYSLTFFQRSNSDLIFEYETKNRLNVGLNYKVKITNIDSIFKMVVLSDDIKTYIDDSGDQQGVNGKYSSITVCKGHDQRRDREEESSGILENLKIKPYIYEVFISYSSDGGYECGKHLYTCLVRRDISVYFYDKKTQLDGVTPDSMDMWPEMEKALSNSKRIILLMSSGFNKSEGVIHELSLWNEKYKDKNIQLKPYKFKNTQKKDMIITLHSGKILDFNKSRYELVDSKDDLYNDVYTLVTKEPDSEYSAQ